VLEHAVRVGTGAYTNPRLKEGVGETRRQEETKVPPFRLFQVETRGLKGKRFVRSHKLEKNKKKRWGTLDLLNKALKKKKGYHDRSF